MTAYTQRQHLNYTAAQLFDLVADVERYPEFMPWVTDAQIRHRKDHTIAVDMTIAAGPLRKRFSTVAVLDRPHRINITSRDPLFDRFEQRWTFVPVTGGATDIEYHVDWNFQSRLLQMLLGAAFAEQAAATISAFRRRAIRLYSAPS